MSDTVSRFVEGGLLIIFEGIDGAGKTTQLQQAEQTLREQGWAVETLRNPGGSAIGEALREVSLKPIERPAMTDLYISAAIHEALIAAIDTAREQNKIILLDRGPLSMAAYQIYGGGIDAQTGWEFVDRNMQRLHAELTIVYQLNAKAALDRIQANKARDHFESKPIDYFERVAQGYAEAVRRYSTQIIDANQSIETVQAQTMALIEPFLKRV